MLTVRRHAMFVSRLGIGLVLLVGLCGSEPAQAATDLQLARDHRPILKFDSAERWRPLEINAFLGESLSAGTPHKICTAPAVCDRVAARPADLLAGTILDVGGEGRDGRGYGRPDVGPCARPQGVVDCDAGPRSVMYYDVTRAGGRVIIDYWWFLRYNDYPNEDDLKCRRLTPCHDHEGDWEGVRVLFAADAPHRIDVRFDAHGRSERYTKLKPQRVDDRPVVYVALGTHASYPRPCKRNFCVQSGARLPDGRYNGSRDWGRNSRQDCGGGSCLHPLPRGDWATWRGLWGRGCRSNGCVREAGPTSPGLQSRSNVLALPRTEFAPISRGAAYRLIIAHVAGR
jgi:hypothetical protein